MADEADLRTEGTKTLEIRDHGDRWRVVGPCFPGLLPLFCRDSPVGLTHLGAFMYRGAPLGSIHFVFLLSPMGPLAMQ